MADIITVEIQLDDKKAVKQVKSFKGKAKKLGSEGGDNFGSGFTSGFANQLKRIGPLIATAFSVAAVVDAVNQFTKFEKSLVGIQKTTDLTNTQMIKFSDTLQTLSERIPLTAAELAGLTETAGRFGVRGSRNLEIFTETLAKLQVATDLVGEEGAQALAKILGVTREAPKDIATLGAVITDLGNNFRTSESQIVSAANEVARATTVFRLSSAQVVAVATALKDLGARSEGAGTAVGKAFRVIEKAIRKGGIELQTIIRLTGLTGDQLKKTFEKDAFEVFRLFIKGLNRVDKTNRSLTSTLEGLGLAQDRTLKVLSPLATGYDRLQLAIDRANAQVLNATALNEEASKAFDTLGSDLVTAGNAFRNLANDIVNEFSPGLRAATANVKEFFQRLSLGLKATAGDELAKIEIQIKDLTDTIEQAKAAGEFVGNIRNFLGLSTEQVNNDITELQTELTNLLTTRLNIIRDRANQDGKEIGKNLTSGIGAGITEGLAVSVDPSLEEMAAKIRSITLDEIAGSIFPKFITKTAEDLKKLTKVVKAETTRIASAFRLTFVQGIGNAFAAFGSALVRGEDGLKAIGKSILSTLGALAIQVGQFFILVGVGMSAVSTFLGLQGGAAIAAGIALTTLGGVLQAVGGATEAPAGGGAGGGGGADAGQPVSTLPVGEVGEEFEDIEMQRPTEITVNVEGLAAIGDKRELALSIAEIIKDGIATNDIGLTVA